MRGSALFEEIDLAVTKLLAFAQRPGRGPNAGLADARLEDRFLYLPYAPKNYAEKTEELDDLFQAVSDLRPLSLLYRSAGKQGGRARGTDEDEPEENENREVEGRAESREHASGDPEGEAGDQHGHSPEPIHGAARGKRRQSPGSQDDGRPQPDEAAHADDKDDGQRRDCRRELQHRRVRRQRRREQDRVAADGRLRHRLRIAYGP